MAQALGLQGSRTLGRSEDVSMRNTQKFYVWVLPRPSSSSELRRSLGAVVALVTPENS